MATVLRLLLLAYLLYRTRSPRYLFAAARVGAATSNSYSNGRGDGAAVFLLAVTDLRSTGTGKVVLQALALAALLAIPSASSAPPRTPSGDQLRVIRSYWFTSQPAHQKALQFART